MYYALVEKNIKMVILVSYSSKAMRNIKIMLYLVLLFRLDFCDGQFIEL